MPCRGPGRVSAQFAIHPGSSAGCAAGSKDRVQAWPCPTRDPFQKVRKLSDIAHECVRHITLSGELCHKRPSNLSATRACIFALSKVVRGPAIPGLL